MEHIVDSIRLRFAFSTFRPQLCVSSHATSNAMVVFFAVCVCFVRGGVVVRGWRLALLSIVSGAAAG